MKRDGEEGVALLTVLVMVAVMAALSVALLDDIRFAIRRTANSEATAQARWYALGAEKLAAAQIARLNEAGQGRTTLESGWHGKVTRYPVDGGVIEMRVTDGAACFNLNSVVIGEGDQLERRDAGVRQFLALAEGLGLDAGEAERLGAALVDWIDTDILRESAGAEDEAYEEASYRTAGALLAEPSELRAIRGFTPEVYARLRPLVCALPSPELSPINVNTLTEDRARLLSALTEGDLSESAARRLIAERPAGGWASGEDFWASPALAGLTPTNEAAGQVQVKTRFFALQTQVVYGDAEVTASALLEDQDGRVRVVARRWGPEE